MVKMKKRGLFSSLSSTINAFYILLIFLFVLLTGSILYYVANNQISRHSEAGIQSALEQKMEYLSFLYRDIFEQFYFLSQDYPAQQLMNATQPSAQQYLNLTEEVNDLYKRNSTFIDSIFISLRNGRYLITHSEQQDLDPTFKLDSYYEKGKDAREGYYWLNQHADPIFDQHQDVQSIVYTARSAAGEEKGLMVVNVKAAFIRDILQDTAMEGSYMLLLDQEGYFTPSSSQSSLLNEKVYELYKTGQLLQGEVNSISLKGMGEYWLSHATIGTNKWEAVLLAPKSPALGSASLVLLLSLLLSLLLAFLATFFLRVIRRYISHPIEKLAESMLSTETVNEKLTWSKDVPEELAVLYESFNQLTDRNTRLIQGMTAQQEEKRELELALLHAQVSPHFLYNTLYSIKGLCEMGLTQEASQMISQLSDFFRTSLSRGKEVITIEEELKNVKSYLYIMESRYGDFFSYEILIPDELRSYGIVKLSLQPLIENAIYHGVMEDREKGLIQIVGECNGKDLLLHVRDNGQGMETEKLAKIKEEMQLPYPTESREVIGVGLRSVDIRIKNRYGDHYGLTIESVYQEYTDVTIRIPKGKSEKNV